MPYHVGFVFHLPGTPEKQRSIGIYNNAATPDELSVRSKKLADLIQGMQGVQTKFRRLRYSLVGAKRKIKGEKFSYSRNKDDSVTQDTDVAKTCLELILWSGVEANVSINLPGIPDDIAKKGIFLDNADFKRGFDAFALHIKKAAEGWHINVLDPADVWKDIEKITKAGVIEIVGHGFANGNLIKVSQVRGYQEVNGTYKIQKIDDDSFRLLDFGEPRAGLDFVENGRVKRQNKGMLPITKVTIGDVRGHDVGKPS